MTAPRHPRYPAGTVRALLDSPHVTERTREVLRARLALPDDASPRALDADLFATLRAVCARLIPQDGLRDRFVDVARDVDRQLADGPGNGWRYATMPPDRELFASGLAGVESLARQHGASSFSALPAAEQDALLARVQRGAVSGVVPARFFEELLAAAVEAYYSHPLAQETIGYAGMADAPAGWARIALGEREAREPEALSPAALAPAALALAALAPTAE